MGSQPKSSRLAKPPNQSPPTSRSPSSSLSSHLAMVELKQRILTSISKLSDRDTHQIAIEDLEKIIQFISPEAIPMLLNCLYDASADPKPAVKKESLKLLIVVCAYHGDSTSTHLTKIIGHIVRRLKDSDSSVRDACRDAIGALSAQYIKGDASGGDNGGLGSVVALFVKPLFEAMGEQNKGVQSGAAMCMAKMVECASSPPVLAFQKLCPKICKLLNNPNFLAKSALLPVVANLSQVGAISPQSLDNLLQNTHECLASADWVTRKAAAETLTALALHSSNLITDGGDATLTALEACRFDKIKPVRDSMTEALQLWKKLAGKGDEVVETQKASPRDELSDQPGMTETENQKKIASNDITGEPQSKDVVDNSTSNSNSNSVDKMKCGSIPDKAVVILKKKALALTDKEPNPEFFQKLQTRGSGDLPVEVIVPRRFLTSSNAKNEELEPNNSDPRGKTSRHGDNHSDDVHGSYSKYRNLERGAAIPHPKMRDYDDLAREKLHEGRANGKDTRTKGYDGDNRIDSNHRESSGNLSNFSKAEAQSEGTFMNNKGSWLAIQRQLLQLERQQAHLMNMVQDFIGGSHDSMITLENRVRGLERVVEDMARDFSGSSGRKSNFVMGFEGSSNRPLGKFNALPEYSGAKFGRSSDGRVAYGERFNQTDGISSFMRGRGPPWRSDMHDGRDMSSYGTSRNGQMVSKRAPGGGSMDDRSPKSENESDQIASRRAWDKGAGPVRHGEGPSARSVWQASKDEATLEAIRVAGEDGGTSRTARVPIAESTAEAIKDNNTGQERDLVWTSWRNAMDALHVGDMDSAYAEVLSTSDDILLIKLMDKSGPVIDLLSDEVAAEVLHAVGQFLLEQNLFDICLSWIQRLVENVIEYGPDFLGFPMELKKEILLNLHEASSTMDLPEDWDGALPDQLLSQLASAWEIDLRQHE